MCDVYIYMLKFIEMICIDSSYRLASSCSRVFHIYKWNEWGLDWDSRVVKALF